MNFNHQEIFRAEERSGERSKERIEIIKSLRTGFMQKANLILVLLKEKPATDLTIFVKTAEELSEEEEKIKRIGLKFEKIKQQEKNGRQVVEYSVASDENNLSELLGVDPSADHEKYGLLMGYPPSAVKAFMDGELIDPDAERKILAENSDIVFSNFRLSKSNNRAELEVLRRWSRRIEEEALDIYEMLKGK